VAARLLLDVRREVEHPVPATVADGAAIPDAAVGRQGVIVVGGVHHARQADLLEVADVARLLGRLLGLGKHGEEDGSQDGDDRNHHQKFDESKRAAHTANLSAEC